MISISVPETERRPRRGRAVAVAKPAAKSKKGRGRVVKPKAMPKSIAQSPEGRRRALFAHITIAKKRGDEAKIRQAEERYAAHMKANPDLKTPDPKAPKAPRQRKQADGVEKPVDPRRTYASMRAWVKIHRDRGNEDAALDQESAAKAFAEKHPGCDVPAKPAKPPKPKSEDPIDLAREERARKLQERRAARRN